MRIPSENRSAWLWAARMGSTAASGAAGAAFMNTYHHDGYSCSEGARAAVVGGAAFILPVGAALLAIEGLCFGRIEMDRGRIERDRSMRPLWLVVAVAALDTAYSAASTATGTAILRSAGLHVSMTAREAAIVGMVGYLCVRAGMAVAYDGICVMEYYVMGGNESEILRHPDESIPLE